MSGIFHDIGMFTKDAATAPVEGAKAAGNAISDLLSPQMAPNLQSPKTKAPNQQDAATSTLQTQLAHEQNARSTAALLTGPGGLTSDPTTTSSLLMGT